MSENIFDYNPIREWNGKVIDFGTGSSTNDNALTAIVLDSEGAQEASARVVFEEYDSIQYKEINRIIRLLFSGEPLDVEIYDLTDIEEFDSEFIEIFIFINHPEILSVSPAGQELVKYEIEIDHTNPHFVISADNPASSQYMLKYIEEPRDMTTVNARYSSVDLQLDGMPYIEISWSNTIISGRCSDSVYNDQASCETSIKTSAHCRNGQGWEILTLPQNDGNQVVAYDTESECLNLDGGDVEQTGYGKCYYTYNQMTSWTYYSSANKLEQCEAIADNYNFYKFVWWEGPDYYDCFSCLEYLYFPSIDSVGLSRTANTAPYSTPAQCANATNLVQLHEAWAGTIGTGGGEWEKQYFATYPGSPTGQTLCENQNCHWIIDEPRNTWVPETYNSWWPSVETVNQLQNNIVYEGDGVYFYPKDVSQVPLDMNIITLAYGLDFNDTSLGSIDVGTVGQMKRGRQSRIFYSVPRLVIGTEEHISKINPNNYIIEQFQGHLNVDHKKSRPENTFGYTSFNDKTQIEWRPPEWDTSIASRRYVLPDRYRVYRSNQYYYGITSPTELTMGIKRLVGEVEHSSNVDRHYFTEDEQDLRTEGMQSFQRMYYWVTAVWDDWGNTNRGIGKITYDGYFADDLDFFANNQGNILSTVDGVLEINYPRQSDNTFNNGEDFSDEYFGYFKPTATGDYGFSMTSDDSSWMWIGTAGQTVEDLKATRNNQNALIDNSGLHGSQTVNALTTMLDAHIYYPILIYFGNKKYQNSNGSWEHRVSFTPPEGPVTVGGISHNSGVGYWYRTNDNQFQGTGQEVEGRFDAENNSGVVSNDTFSYFQ
jgi:hypothetical protein